MFLNRLFETVCYSKLLSQTYTSKANNILFNVIWLKTKINTSSNDTPIVQKQP